MILDSRGGTDVITGFLQEGGRGGSCREEGRTCDDRSKRLE